MKRTKLLGLDKISIAIIILNFVAFLSTFIFSETLYHINNLFDTIVAALMLYTVFGALIMILLGIVLNALSRIKKRKLHIETRLNNILFVIFILMIPIWWYFWMGALMGI